jgi:hypothetical protein
MIPRRCYSGFSDEFDSDSFRVPWQPSLVIDSYAVERSLPKLLWRFTVDLILGKEKRIRCVDCHRQWVKGSQGRWGIDVPQNPS